ncbi:hypothetical protein J2X57_002000 [Luteibacter sp. 1214]|uniref:hypothetical protein n=1 Tax=Luteibacter sp. 1214 TaxID=2817735 RepID=UPI0028644A77|nr:hypothetical protein [Luteibacter sp. 1214]MDR6642788.1 hypothetical protein [Luteibacter sp. 1214]
MSDRESDSLAARARADEELANAVQATYAAHTGIVSAWANGTITHADAYELLHTVDVRLAAALYDVRHALGLEDKA